MLGCATLPKYNSPSSCAWRIVISPKIPQDSPSCYHSLVRNLPVLFIHFIAVLARLLGPGGVCFAKSSAETKLGTFLGRVDRPMCAHFLVASGIRDADIVSGGLEFTGDHAADVPGSNYPYFHAVYLLNRDDIVESAHAGNRSGGRTPQGFTPIIRRCFRCNLAPPPYLARRLPVKLRSEPISWKHPRAAGS